MKKIFSKVSIAFFVMLLLSCGKDKEKIVGNYDIIPLPQEIKLAKGDGFILKETTTISYPEGNTKLAQTADFLSEYIEFSTNMKLKTAPEVKSSNVIKLETGLNNSNPDAYTLTVNDNEIVIKGASDAAVFYGVQTLRKSIPAYSDGFDVLLPAVSIVDKPRFGYRGMHLDVSRHFFPVEFVKKYIDILALHNINTFHWHLTDDQGWRIEIKSHPKLAEIASMRKETLIGSLYNEEPHQYDGIPHGGGYTQEEIKDVVQYAQDRFITIIPEIDLPGHMLAVLSAYPELGCTGGPYDAATTWGIFDDVLCAGNDDVYTFLEDVFGEVIELFPSEYIHIGGDECPKTRWEKCPKCQARMKQEGIVTDAHSKKEEKLQTYMMSKVEKFLNDRGRRIIGWDEILQGGITPNATIMSWRGTEGGIEAARLNHDAIMVPGPYLYFDYYQARDKDSEPLAIGGYSPLDWIYSYNPVPDVLTEDQKKHIIGVQANLWVEYIKTTDQIEYMVIPRMAALSEIQWCNQDKRNFKAFMKRLPNMLSYYQKMDLNIAPHVFGVYSEVEKNKDNTLNVSLISLGDAPIFYTIDGTDPTETSTRYQSPITIPNSTELKAIAIHPNRANTPMLVELDKQEPIL